MGHTVTGTEFKKGNVIKPHQQEREGGQREKKKKKINISQSNNYESKRWPSLLLPDHHVKA